MFMLYMGTRENQGITVSRNDVVMIYKDQEYKMPTVKEIYFIGIIWLYSRISDLKMNFFGPDVILEEFAGSLRLNN
jgi:hypothetical protein